MPAPKCRSIRGFFGTDSAPYYIYAPDYKNSSAGVRSLHYLCHALNELGCEAYVAPARQKNISLRTPTLTPTILLGHFLSGKTPIAVQPETVSGNFFEIPSVVTWLLNRPGHLAPSETYTKRLIFYFYEWVRPVGVEAEQLTVPVMDISVFNNENNPHDSQRELECYYAHKFIAFGHEVPHDIRQRAISLCHDIPRTTGEITEILRKAKVLYCFEETAMISEALLCGCPVVLMPSQYFRKENWRPEWIPQGAAWLDEVDSFDELRARIGKFREAYEESHKYCWNTVSNFIDRTQKEFALSVPSSETMDGVADLEHLWRVPAGQRPNHVEAFLLAVSRSRALSSLDHSTPALKLADWLYRVTSETPELTPEVSQAQSGMDGCEPPQHLPATEEAVLLAEVSSLLHAGHFDQATVRLKYLVSHEALDWTIYETLGQLYAERGELDGAAGVLLRGAALEFSGTQCLRKLAAVYAMRGDAWRTLAACSQILKREPDDSDMHLFVRDILVSTSPRFDDISWLAPEWTTLIDEYRNYRGNMSALLRKLKEKARLILLDQAPRES